MSRVTIAPTIRRASFGSPSTARRSTGASYYQFIKRRNELAQSAPDWRPTAEHYEAANRLISEGFSDHMMLISAAADSLSHSIEEMLRSRHPLIRALAILDRRMGRRRLDQFDFTSEHELVRLASALRAKPKPTDVADAE